MRATASSSPVRHGKHRLLTSCAIAAGVAALAYGGPTLAQVQGTGGFATGTGSINSNPDTSSTTVGLDQAQSIINWTPTDTAPTGGAIDFLPTGNTLTFNGSGDYTVLNRFVDAGGGSLGRQVALNGTVNSTDIMTSGGRGGNIWFYNAGGILVGATGVINVGSLVLTTNDIVTTGGLFGPGGEIRFNGLSGGTSTITVNGEINANNAFNPGSSYVALVAPRVVQAGAVRVDGSAAYVAAEQAEIRINSGLFDINVLVGAEGGNVITHSGSTTGPAHQQGDIDQSRIYMVAIPKNDAVTMLVSGSIGYDDALSAQLDPDGGVVLSGGYNIVSGATDGAPVNATPANITINDTLFGSDTFVRASGALAAQPLQPLAATPLPETPPGRVTVLGNGTFIGDASASFAIGVNQAGGATGDLIVQSGGANGAPGNAAVTVTGGELVVGGTLSVAAGGQIDAATGGSSAGNAAFAMTGGDVQVAGLFVAADAEAGEGVSGTGGTGVGGSSTIDLLGGTLTTGGITASATGGGGDGADANDENPASTVPGGTGGVGQGGSAAITIDGATVISTGTVAAYANGQGGQGGNFSSFNGTAETGGAGGTGQGGTASINVVSGTLNTGDLIAGAGGFGGNGGSVFASSSSGSVTGTGAGGTGGTGRGGTATIDLAAAVNALGGVTSTAASLGGNGGFGIIGGTGGDSFGGLAQIIVTGFDAGPLAVTVDASANGGDGAFANNGAGGDGGDATGGVARIEATGASASATVTQTNFVTGGTGGDGGSAGSSFFGGAPVGAAGGSGGSGTGGTIDVVASDGATIAIAAASAGPVALSSSGTGGNGGTGAFNGFGAGFVGGDGGDGGAGIGGTVSLRGDGGTVTSNGNAVNITVGGTSGGGGTGGTGTDANGADGALSQTSGGRALIQALATSTPAQVTLGDTSIVASGDNAGRIELRTDGNIALASLDAQALGLTAPTNNDTDVATTGIFLAATGGTITTTGAMTLTTDGSVGIYAQSNGGVRAGADLTLQAGDQIDVRHDLRTGGAPTVEAVGDFTATAATSISGAPDSLLGAGNTLTLNATGPNGSIGVDGLDGLNIVITSTAATNVEHAEAVNDFTATVGSFRTGLNSIITGGNINITSPGTIDLGNSSAGGFVFVEGQTIAFNNVDAGTFVSLRANGLGLTDGVTGANITAGGPVSLNGGGVALSGTLQSGDSLSVTANQRDAAIGLATAVGNISVFAGGNMTGVYRAGGNVNLNANGTIAAEADATGGFVDSSSGLLSEGSVLVDGDGDVTLSNSSAATMIGLRSGGTAALTGSTAGEDVFVLATTTANLTDVTAGDDITVQSVGGITIANAQTTGSGPDGRSVVYAPGASVPTPFLQIQTTAADLSNINLLAPNGVIGAANVSAFDNLNLTGGTIAASGPLTAGANIVAAATGSVDLDEAAAGGFVQATGQSIAFDTVTAGLTVNLTADGAAAGAEGIDGGSIAAGGDITLFGNSIALTGTVTGDAAFFAFGTGGGVAVNRANVDGTISIFSATDMTGTYVAGGNIFLNSNGNIAASAQANGGYVDGNGFVADGNLFVVAAGDATLTNSSAARMFGVNAGLAAAVNGGTAGEDMLVLGGTTAALTNVTAGDDVTVRAPGTITAQNVSTTGAGADTHILDFSSASGSPSFTIDPGVGTQGTDGADIVMTSAAGGINVGALSAGDDILLTAAGGIDVNGATTLGLGTTGGDSSIRTQGGATTLAGLDSFSDVVVDAAGLASLTGPVAAGRDATITAEDVTLAVLATPGGNAVDTLTATGNVVVNAAAGIAGGDIAALGDTTLTAGTAIGVRNVRGVNIALDGATGVTAAQLSASGTTTLDSGGGTVTVGTLAAIGPITANANAIRIEGGGDMNFTSLVTDVGDAYVRTGGNLTVANATVTGTADLGTTGDAMNVANLTAANATLTNTTGFVNLDGVNVAGNLAASARTSLGVNGVVNGQSVALASAAIAITPSGRVGTAGTTQNVSLTNNNNSNQTFIGGTGTPSGYHLDAAELTRVFGTQIRVVAPEVAAAGGGSVGSSAPPDLVVDSFTLAGGGPTTNLGANGALTLETPGKMRVIGNVELTGLTDANALNLFAGEALEVILGQATVRLVNGANPAGQLNMVSDDIIVATQAAITAVGAATTTDAINTRLAENDGVVLDEGALFARGIRAEIVGGFYVQNSGASTEFADRRGLTFGAGGLDVQTQGPSRIVINGVQLGANGQVTGLDTIPLLTIGGSAPSTGSFDRRSTFNGCLIAGAGSCNAVSFDFESSFPVQDVIEEEADAEDEDGEGNSLPTPLITMRDLDPLSGEPLLDDPVTGAGNDDLWTPAEQP